MNGAPKWLLYVPVAAALASLAGAVITQGLPDLLQRARQSHERVLAMQGLVRSGNWQVWQEAHAQDAAAAEWLVQGLPAVTAAYETLDAGALEARLRALADLRPQAERLRDKYTAELAADDTARGERRAQAAAEVAAIKGRTEQR
jgi:hypothetical protein